MPSAENDATLPTLCDQRGARCCGTPACLNAGLWTDDPYDEPIYVSSRYSTGQMDRGHMHSEPVCAFPECETYLTRVVMATMRARQSSVIPPEVRESEESSRDDL